MRLTPDHRQKTTAGAQGAAHSARLRDASRLSSAAVSALVLLAGVTGCTGGTASEVRPGPTAPVAASPAATQTEAATPLADTASRAPAPAADAAATETVKQTVTATLGGLAAAAPKPATAQVTDALTAAGIAPSALQVSQSRTPTGLEADAIEAAVLQGKDCVIGQVREGTVTVTVLPVLASGKCFVGS